MKFYCRRGNERRHHSKDDIPVVDRKATFTAPFEPDSVEAILISVSENEMLDQKAFGRWHLEQKGIVIKTPQSHIAEIIAKRETAKGVIAETIRKTLSERNISVETVFITDFKFSDAFATQIESKVVAYQKFLTEENNLKAIQVIANQTVIQAEAQARANVAKANGEAQAIKIINEELKQSPDYLKWQAINKWNGQMPYVLGSGGFPFFQLPVQPQ